MNDASGILGMAHRHQLSEDRRLAQEQSFEDRLNRLEQMVAALALEIAKLDLRSIEQEFKKLSKALEK